MNFKSDAKNLRLDVYLGEKFPDKSRSHIQKIIGSGGVTINGETVKPSFNLADVAVVAGMFVMIYVIIFMDDKGARQ